MSTPIKNTLFRFVTMRAPELSDENQKDKRFVFRKQKTHDSLFDEAVKSKSNTVSNWQALQSAAAAFIPLTEATLKTNINTDYLDFAIWIARNKHSFSTQELLEKVKLLKNSSTVSKLAPETLTLLWNNLFYQVVTQKDFYVKETIMQLLIANHIYANIDSIEKGYEDIAKLKLKNPGSETELIKNIVNAKVVLPKELFDEKKPSASSAARTSLKNMEIVADQPIVSVPNEDMVQFIATSQAATDIDRHLKLKGELQKVEKIYQKQYQESYDKAIEAYNAKVEPILEEYNQRVEQNKRTWCASRTAAYAPNDPCNQLPVIPQPKLPKFEFKYELDLNYLQSQLTQNSFHTLLDVLEIETANDKVSEPSTITPSITIESSGQTSGSFPIMPLPSPPISANMPKANLRIVPGVPNTLVFSDVYSLVNDAISSNSETIINNTPNQGNSSVSIGGVIVPVVPKQTVPFGYQVCSKKYRRRLAFVKMDFVNFDMTLDLPDSTWQITRVETALTQNATTTTSSVFNQLRTGNTVKLDALYDEKSLFYLIFSSGIANLTITITFSNGAIKSFSSGFWNSISCLSGTLATIKDVPTLPIGSGPTGPGPSNPIKVDNGFIPSGFGVKRLGIADYKKVEQTVQGYVEGEVAAIENIMAREYKEKATRRLRRSENTTTTSSETEKEQLSDTTSTNRFEMQSEVAKVLQEGKDFAAGASFNAEWGAYSLGTNVNVASHSSKEESTRQAVTQAKEVTERAMERITAKVKQERIEKIVEEFEENNKHGFDNTKGDKHVVGVYRWVDKVFKNQIFNYGKRLMFEFMVPEPAKLHLLGMAENTEGIRLVKPDDPRTFTDPAGAVIKFNLKDHTLINDNTLKFWGGKLNVELSPMKELVAYAGKSISGEHVGNISSVEYFSAKEEIRVPEGYKAVSANVSINAIDDGDQRNGKGVLISVGDTVFSDRSKSSLVSLLGNYKPISNFINTVPVSATFGNYFSGSATISVRCDLTNEAKIKWQQETFKAIIDAYEDALAAYEQKVAEENAKGSIIKEANPGFYRQIENMILRKNCISYIIDQNEAASRTYGKNMSKPLASGLDRKFSNHEVNVGPGLDDYAAFSKFIEQAFEWEIMSYNFYPYYWGAKEDWSKLYQYENNDPLFKSFMQAGMARVIVTVRPGFEDAVNYYMQTGQIWNGGEVPVIEDKLFMAIVDELRQPAGKKEGKAWATRLPTALTILQADSIGLKVDKALPYDADLSEFEDPASVPQSANFEITGAKLSGSTNIDVPIVIRNPNPSAPATIAGL